MNEIWPLINIGLNLVIGLLGFLLVRWIAGQIRIAILELETRLTQLYATKADLAAAEARLNEKVAIAKRLDEGFGKTLELLRRDVPRDATGAMVR